MLEDFLPLVTKPARYIDSEVNCVHKDLTSVKTKVCLLFPDTYEVGMSHLGIRILYHILNNRQDTACERVFSPWTDYEELLRASGRPLTSLESNVPLAEFDIIGVTLQYELSFTNILTALELGHIPVRSSDRKNGHPVVIAGGPCAVNPEPLSDFIDAFFIGEAEDALHEMIELKQSAGDRLQFLNSLSRCEGFTVPMLGKQTVRRRTVGDLDAAAYPDKPILPLMKPVHDRATAEIARGCIRGCRYCQAGIIYRPYRERSKETIQGLLQESLSCTGYDELSLASLSAGDYSDIRRLVSDLFNRYRDDRVSISLPSLRVGTLTKDMITAIAGVRKTGFTLAPEAGTERLRHVINKPLSEAELKEAAEFIFSSGWHVLKLYFMIGLPTETQDDLDGIIRIARDLFALGKQLSKRHVQLNISISTFVPKTHTPFQWFGQIPPTVIREKQTYLEKGLRRRGITLKFHTVEMSLLEAVFARGDRALGPVLEKAVRLGCRFDGWTECFDFSKWSEAFRACGIDYAEFAGRSYRQEDELPWDHIHTGVTKEFLRREYRRALSAEITENCREHCEGCGIGCTDGGTPLFGKAGTEAGVAGKTTRSGAGDRSSGTERKQEKRNLTTRIRMRYTKKGPIRFLSHLDLMTLFQRAATRAEIPLAFSQGFNPHPRMSFGPALSVGVESEAEYLDMETDPFIDLSKATRDLNSTLPEGIEVLEARIIPKSAPSLSKSIATFMYNILIPPRYGENIRERIENFMALSSVSVIKKGKERDIKPAIESVAVNDGADPLAIDICLRERNGISARPVEVIEALLNIGPADSSLFRIMRTAVQANVGGSWIDPLGMQ